MVSTVRDLGQNFQPYYQISGDGTLPVPNNLRNVCSYQQLSFPNNMHSVLPEVISPNKCFTGIDIEHGSGADIDTIQPTNIQYLFEKETKIQTFGNAHCTTTSQVQLRPPHNLHSIISKCDATCHLQWNNPRLEMEPLILLWNNPKVWLYTPH